MKCKGSASNPKNFFKVQGPRACTFLGQKLSYVAQQYSLHFFAVELEIVLTKSYPQKDYIRMQ